MRAGLIGVGNIGSYLLKCIQQGIAGPIELVGISDVVGLEARLVELANEVGCAYTTNALELVDQQPDIVIEAASQAAIRQYAVPLLERGVNLLIMSVGALADATLFDAVIRVARQSGRRVCLPPGAVGGLDVLRAARLGGLEEVTLVTSKPPRALAGAPFFDQHPIDLDAITQRTVIFEGSARDAVGLFPANVNVAAAVSLAGLGPERTRMRVVADPLLDRNIHEVFARGGFGDFSLKVSNVPSPANPKTSFLACLSALATLRQLADPLQIG